MEWGFHPILSVIGIVTIHLLRNIILSHECGIFFLRNLIVLTFENYV
jgi:hypothetical protein